MKPHPKYKVGRKVWCTWCPKIHATKISECVTYHFNFQPFYRLMHGPKQRAKHIQLHEEQYIGATEADAIMIRMMFPWRQSAS